MCRHAPFSTPASPAQLSSDFQQARPGRSFHSCDVHDGGIRPSG